MEPTHLAETPERARAKVDFWSHLSVFLLIIALLSAIQLWSERTQSWVSWPMLLWGMYLLWHGLNVFVFSHPTLLRRRDGHIAGHG